MNQLFMAGPYVIKIGGSLERQLDRLLEVIVHSPTPALIVPGGGRFARMVRETAIKGTYAHWMAIAAMEQFGWLIASKGVRYGSVLHRPEASELLLPYLPLLESDPLPHTWDVTSDTIAAWVAWSLGLDLILLKSVDGIFSEGVLQESVASLRETDTVDPAFIPFVLEKRVRAKIINGNVPERLASFLRGYPVIGTTIGF
jgi:aspartokinase-like uncharacterized kinase